jgi:magnesium chelatase family protein
VARLALEVAAAGGHHLLMVGPPGAGKTMLARRLPGLLPDLAPDAALEATMVHSAAGLSLPPTGLVLRPPLRAPHHGSSAVALVGGGTTYMRPGEISLASQGVLFLDELAEFPRSVLDALRQPLEEGVVRVCRARAAVAYPARFLLVGAMNPCPCGEGGPPGACRCSDATRIRYGRRISGPLLDRFDLRIEVTRAHPADLLAGVPGEASAVVAARVVAARCRAADRGVSCNAELSGRRLEREGRLSAGAAAMLEGGLRSGSLSARGLQRVRRVARTLADLAGREGTLGEEDVCLALQLRAEPARLGAAA